MLLKLNSVNELAEKINQMNKDNPICEFEVTGKGKFKIILQTEGVNSIYDDVLRDKSLGEMINASREAYRNQKHLTTNELIEKIKEKKFND